MSSSEKQEKLTNISIEKLQKSKLNKFEINDIEELKGNIQSVGLLTPLSVIGPDENGNYCILSGERRYTALRQIHDEDNTKFAKVPCYILDTSDMDEILQEITIISSNVETRDFDKHQYRFHIINLLKSLSESGEIKKSKIVAEAGKYMKVSPRYRSMYIQIFDKGIDGLSDSVGKKTASGVTLTVVDANKIAAMDKKDQQEVMKDISNGTTPKEAINAISEINSFEDVSKFDTDDLIDFMCENKQDTNLELDTTGEFKSLKSRADQDGILASSQKKEKEEKEKQELMCSIRAWCDRMGEKSTYSVEEMKTFESMRELLNHLDDIAITV